MLKNDMAIRNSILKFEDDNPRILQTNTVGNTFKNDVIHFLRKKSCNLNSYKKI